MPELPEIEVLKNSLEQMLIGIVIRNTILRRKDLRYPLSKNLITCSVYSRIIALRRRAKYLIIDLDNGYSLVMHLGMSGRITLQNSDYQVRAHDHVIIELSDDNKLIFNDARRFGMIYVYRTAVLDKELFYDLSIEPLSDLFTSEYLHSKTVNRTIHIKNLLMDNKIVVGIGNIYASESLFLAKIHPETLSSQLTEEKTAMLVRAIKDILSRAILAGGTTLKDFVDSKNVPGRFTRQLMVYNRKGQSCYYCKGRIIKIMQRGRSSFFCQNCQNEKS